MRTLLIAATAWLGLVAAPLAAHAAGVAPGVGDTATGIPKVVVAQSSGTVLPGVTVTAPTPRPMNPWDISTWRFHAGPSPYHPEGRSGYGAGSSGGYGAVVAPPAH